MLIESAEMLVKKIKGILEGTDDNQPKFSSGTYNYTYLPQPVLNPLKYSITTSTIAMAIATAAYMALMRNAIAIQHTNPRTHVLQWKYLNVGLERKYVVGVSYTESQSVSCW